DAPRTASGSENDVPVDPHLSSEPVGTDKRCQVVNQYDAVARENGRRVDEREQGFICGCTWQDNLLPHMITPSTGWAGNRARDSLVGNAGWRIDVCLQTKGNRGVEQ